MTVVPDGAVLIPMHGAVLSGNGAVLPPRQATANKRMAASKANFQVVPTTLLPRLLPFVWMYGALNR
jgi:hypothetical protein